MGKKSKSKGVHVKLEQPKLEPEVVEAVQEPKVVEAVQEPEVVEAVQEQVKHQNTSALTDGFAQSAAFFGKKASYAPAVVEKPTEEPKTPKEQSKEVKTTDEKKKKKKEKKPKKKKQEEEEQEEEKELTDEELKSRRTVFVGNVSLDATQKDIKNHFSVCGKVESVRLRHLPIAGCAVDQAGNQKLMMKVCANKKILTTAKDNCNAYVTFVDESSVEAAIKLNGTTLVQKKIRVDHAEPEIDPRRSIFVGNVPFKCTDDQMLQFFMKRLRTDEEPEPVLNVRLIRDRESGLGKGFGYLLLKTPGLVAKTLALSNLKMENRELRVQVCAKRFKNLRGEETTKEKYEGLRASAGARARRMLKRKAGAEDFDRGFATKKMKRTAAAAGLGKKLKPKHAARKAAKAAAEAEAAAKGKKRKHDHSASKKVEKPKAKKPKHAARKAKQAAAKE